MKNILVQLAHPAHFHFLKLTMDNLKRDGYNVYVLIKTKDILEELLKNSGLEYYNILPVPHRKSKFGLVLDMFIRDYKMAKFALKKNIDILVGSTAEIDHVAWLFRKVAINIGEDDVAVVPAFVKVAKPFVKTLLTPVSCNLGPLEKVGIHYQGCQKLSYLHPNYFTPDKNIVSKYFNPDQPYFLLRFALLKAYHDLDADAHGINTIIAQHLIEKLEPHGNVYITSERELEPQFEKYRIKINPIDMHHVMAYAQLYIGDSQTMAAESGILGVPFIRFNDFVGRIGYLRELEDDYHLGYGVKSNNVEKLYQTVDELLMMDNRKEIFQKRREKYLSDKIDVTAFYTWFIENYPESKRIMKENPDYQYRFK